MVKTLVAGIFLLAGVAAHACQLALARRALARPRETAAPPPEAVAVVRPVYGVTPATPSALASLLWTRPPDPLPAECVFSLQVADDPALPLVRALAAGAPGRATVLVSPLMADVSAKASNLAHGIAATRAPWLVLADADVVMPPGALAALLGPLADPAVGAVGAVPRFSGAQGFWANLYQAHMNSVILLEWLPYAGRVPGLPGAAVALRREAFERAGGPALWRGTVADDIRLGEAVRKAGYRVVAGPVITVETGPCPRRRLVSLLERAAVLFGSAMPRPFLGLHLLVNYAYLIALALPHWRTAAALYLAARSLTYAALEGNWAKACWMLPLDVITVAIGIRTWVSRRVTWEGIRYRLRPGGRLVRES